MSKLSVRECALISQKARDTINTATNNGTLSYTINAKGHKEIDISELERVYPLVRSIDEIRTSEPVRTGPDRTTGDLPAQLAELRARLEGVENERDLLRDERSRERRQLEAEIENLRSSLEKSQQQNERVTLLLTDQRKSEEGRDVGERKKMDEFQLTLELLKRQNKIIHRQLKTQQEKTPLWKRLWK